nr:MAG TPA: Methyl-accepting chemotaxis protein CACHE domain, chemoreceptor, ligand [Caudoviricetes sp.]
MDFGVIGKCHSNHMHSPLLTMNKEYYRYSNQSILRVFLV